MNMRNIFVVVAVSLTGCLVPLNLAEDGGSSAADGGSLGSDAGCDAGEGGTDSGIDWTGAGCLLGELPAQPEGPVTLLFPGCKQQPVIVQTFGAQLQVEVSSDAIGTRVSHAFWPAGLYQVLLGSGPTAQSAQLEVYEQQQPDAGLVLTYVEPIDTCLVPGITDQGRLVCERPGQISVYEADGSVHTRFAGSQAIVVGNEVWTLGAGGIERRVDQPTGLVLTGSLADSRLLEQMPFGEAKAGRSLRRGASELIEFSWDAGVVTSESWPMVLTAETSFVFREGDTFWNDRLCRCDDGACDSVCPFPNHSLMGLGPTSAWAVQLEGPRWRLVEFRRPLGPTSQRLVRTVPFQTQGATITRPGFERPAFILDIAANTSLVLVPHLNGASHFRVMTERIRATTPQAVISLAGPSALRITRHP
jgi:hypothetical protein